MSLQRPSPVTRNPMVCAILRFGAQAWRRWDKTCLTRSVAEHTSACMYAYSTGCIGICIRIFRSMCMYVCMHVCMYVYVCVCMYYCMIVHVFLSVHVCSVFGLVSMHVPRPACRPARKTCLPTALAVYILAFSFYHTSIPFKLSALSCSLALSFSPFFAANSQLPGMSAWLRAWPQ